MSEIRRTYWIERPVPGKTEECVYCGTPAQMEIVDEASGVFVGSAVAGQCKHAPALDIDFNATVHTMGNSGFHFLRINGPRARVKQMNKLLRLLVQYGLIDEAGSKIYGEAESIMDLPMIAFIVPVTLVPSSTPGHHHLYIEKLMSWENYRVLLAALLGANVIHRKFYDLSMRLKQTVLLKPGFTKADLGLKSHGSTVDYGLSYG